jgi:hypothetical protein
VLSWTLVALTLWPKMYFMFAMVINVRNANTHETKG